MIGLGPRRRGYSRERANMPAVRCQLPGGRFWPGGCAVREMPHGACACRGQVAIIAGPSSTTGAAMPAPASVPAAPPAARIAPVAAPVAAAPVPATAPPPSAPSRAVPVSPSSLAPAASPRPSRAASRAPAASAIGPRRLAEIAAALRACGGSHRDHVRGGAAGGTGNRAGRAWSPIVTAAGDADGGAGSRAGRAQTRGDWRRAA